MCHLVEECAVVAVLAVAFNIRNLRNNFTEIFTDVVGSTSLVNWDDTEAHRIFRSVVGSASSVVAKFDVNSARRSFFVRVFVSVCNMQFMFAKENKWEDYFNSVQRLLLVTYYHDTLQSMNSVVSCRPRTSYSIHVGSCSTAEFASLFSHLC